MTVISRRTAFMGALLAASPALAQHWPSRPIRYVVPFAAGAGVLDIMARILAQRLTEKLDQQVVVDNKPGAGGNVGADIVAKAAPDGYTMLMANTALVVSPYLYAKMTFDPLTDLVPVTMVNSAPLMLVVHPSLPVKSVAEFLAHAKANPGKLNYGSGGVGTTPFLAAELLKSDPELRTTPVVMLTAHAFDEHRQRAQDIGTDGFLAKPVLPDELARAVREILDQTSPRED